MKIPFTVSALNGSLYSKLPSFRALDAFKTKACARPIVSLSPDSKDSMKTLPNNL